MGENEKKEIYKGLRYAGLLIVSIFLFFWILNKSVEQSIKEGKENKISEASK